MSDVNIIQAMGSEKLFARWFRNNTWASWTAFLCALFALPMNEDQIKVYRECTGRTETPGGPFKEGWLVCGRRSGKSYVLALVAVFLACFRNYSEFLAPGERGTILILAADRKQSRVIFRFVAALLKQVPSLAKLVENERAESFDLNNRITIEVGTCSYRTVRGYTFVAVLAERACLLAFRGKCVTGR